MPWGVGARVPQGLWAVGFMHMLKLFCIRLAFMGQGFQVWAATCPPAACPVGPWHPRGFRLWGWDATAVPLLGAISPNMWETKIEELG